MLLMTRRELCRCAFGAPSVALFLKDSREGTPGPSPAVTGRVNYMLRYYIRSETASQQTNALIVYCRQHHIRHLILFSDNHWDMGWNLPTLEEASARVAILKPVVRQLHQAGLHTSLNMMTTIGHGDFGRDERSRFSWQFMVGDDGAESHTAPCPLDPTWRDYIAKLYSLYAALEPEILYIDDDFRYHNHQPFAWGCFCPLHLRKMARRTGRNLGREELLDRILTARSQPSEEREQWLKLCGDSILEAARTISESVKKASPQTCMGLMCGVPDVHAAEGWRWDDMVRAMSVSGNQPVLRPSYASYSEGTQRDVVMDLAPLRKLQACLAGKMRLTPEFENFPFTEFSKSARLTRLQIALSAFLAPPDLTLDIHAYTDPQLGDVPAHTKVLDDSFTYFNGVVAWATECRKERGLQVLWDDRLPLHRTLEVARMSALPASPCWEGTLDLLGFATTFYPGEVRVAGSSYLEERTQGEIQSLLKTKLLIDGDAAQLLVERGFGEQVGLKTCAPMGGTNYEQLVNKDFAGRFINQNFASMFSNKYRLEPLEQAILVSKMFGPAASFSAPGMTLFENASGGRVGIIPFSGSHGDLYSLEFRNWVRQFALKKMLEWINRGPLPLVVADAANVLPLRRDGDNAVLIGVANLSADPMPQTVLQLAPPFEVKPVLECLTPEGIRKATEIEAKAVEGYLRLRIPVKIAPLTLVCFRLPRA